SRAIAGPERTRPRSVSKNGRPVRRTGETYRHRAGVRSGSPGCRGQEEVVMKVMVMIKGPGVDEHTVAPTEEMFLEMGRYNEALVDAGVMLDGQGLLPSARGAKVVFEGGEVTVQDGPFAEAKELIGGFWI